MNSVCKTTSAGRRGWQAVTKPGYHLAIAGLALLMSLAGTNAEALSLLGSTSLSLSLGSSLNLSLSSNLQPVTIKFAFDGGFNMYIPPAPGVSILRGGEPHPVEGAMTLSIPLLAPNGPYPGTAEMNSVIPFFGSHWTADGAVTGYQNLAFGGAPDYCGAPWENPMCADADILFTWNGNGIPVDASFGLIPSTGIDPTHLVSSILESWKNGTIVYFAVESLDADNDGILGTAMTQGPFVGFTPFFFGNAIVTEVCLEATWLLPQVCTTIPQGLEWPVITLQ